MGGCGAAAEGAAFGCGSGAGACGGGAGGGAGRLASGCGLGVAFRPCFGDWNTMATGDDSATSGGFGGFGLNTSSRTTARCSASDSGNAQGRRGRGWVPRSRVSQRADKDTAADMRRIIRLRPSASE